MRRAIALSIMLTLIIASTLLSQERQRRDARRRQQPQQAAFQQVFTLPGVEFSEDQRAKVDEIRKKYVPRSAEMQKKQRSIFTEEQMQARREARKESKEARRAAEAAFKLTDDQKEKLATIQKERVELTAYVAHLI